ncbi:hypothetical protein NKR19_g9192 [Coniochaeta hoffmannii]|uniref:Uncharacterized protein n=1 Tax=Coniochaeta hoffmannii TaxID=91930 RepID=A0AA38VDU0_9PEZI|nr:hypothetical protein NKR19_g9192 [Coniochaeta hoffmannii]
MSSEPTTTRPNDYERHLVSETDSDGSISITTTSPTNQEPSTEEIDGAMVIDESARNKHDNESVTAPKSLNIGTRVQEWLESDKKHNDNKSQGSDNESAMTYDLLVLANNDNDHANNDGFLYPGLGTDLILLFFEEDDDDGNTIIEDMD